MRSLIFAALCFASSLSTNFALTGDQVAAFLALSHWETTVTMPKESFIASVKVIIDGKVTNIGLSGDNGADRGGSSPTTNVVIMGQLNKRPAPFTVLLDGMTTSHEFEVPETSGRVTRSLPTEIGHGDYVLGGQPFDDKRADSGKVESYKVGFILRIEKKSDEPK